MQHGTYGWSTSTRLTETTNEINRRQLRLKSLRAYKGTAMNDHCAEEFAGPMILAARNDTCRRNCQPPRRLGRYAYEGLTGPPDTPVPVIDWLSEGNISLRRRGVSTKRSAHGPSYALVVEQD